MQSDGRVGRCTPSCAPPLNGSIIERTNIVVTIWDRWIALRRGRMNLPERVQVDADRLGTAIAEAARVFSVQIKPAWAHAKYFIVGNDLPSQDDLEPGSKQRELIMVPRLGRKVPVTVRGRCQPGYGNTDIHIQRGDDVICPKQDLEFPLRSGDIVIFDMLVC